MKNQKSLLKNARSRHSYIVGHLPLLAAANVLSLFIPGSSGAWGTITDGTSAALVAVCCLTVWPLVRQHKQLITTNTINKQQHHHWLISTWKFMHISLRDSGSTDTILPNKQRVTSRLVSGRHFTLVTENVPEVTHTVPSGANIFIPRCLHQRKILSAGRKVTLLELYD